MSNFEYIESTLNEILGDLKQSFTTNEEQEVREFINVGEYGVALETLCGIVIEENKPVTSNTKLKIAELQRLMGGLESDIVMTLLNKSSSGE